MNEDVKQYLTNALTDVEQIAAFQIQQSTILKDLRKYFELFVSLARHSELEAHALIGEEKELLESILNEIPSYNVSGSVTLSLPSGFPVTMRTLKGTTNITVETLDSSGRWSALFSYDLDTSQRPGYIEFAGTGFQTMSKNAAGQTIKLTWLQICDDLSQAVKLNEAKTTVLDMVNAGTTQLSDLYKVVETKVGVLSGTTKDFMLSLSTYGSTLNRKSVLAMLKNMAQSIAGTHVDDDTQSLIMGDTTFSNKANLGMVIKSAVTTVAQVASSLVLGFISPVAAAIGYGVGQIASFIGQAADNIDSYRVDFDALMYDYGHTLGTLFAPIPTWFNEHKGSFEQYGSTIFHCGPLYVYAIPHFFNNVYDPNRPDPVDYLQFQLRANLAYVPNVQFVLGDAVPSDSSKNYLDRAAIPYFGLQLVRTSDKYDRAIASITLSDPDAVLVGQAMPANFHSSYITQGRIQSEDDVISQLCLTLASVGALIYTDDEFSKSTTISCRQLFTGELFTALPKTPNVDDFAKIIAWLIAYGSSTNVGHRIYFGDGNGSASWHEMGFKWSYISDYFIPWFRKLLYENDYARGQYLLIHALGYVTDNGAVNLPAALSGPSFMLPPTVSSEQFMSSALVMAGLAVAAALVTVGVVRVKKVMNNVRVKRYADVQRKLQAYMNSGSQADLNAYVRSVKSYNRWAPIFGTAKLEMTSGYETTGSSAMDAIDENAIVDLVGHVSNDGSSTLGYTATTPDITVESNNTLQYIKERIG